MKTNYVDKGYPVIVGEFGANVRSPELSGSDLNLHKQGRVQWHKDVVSAAKQYGLTPILWDMGNESNSGYDNMAYIRRQSSPVGKVLETDVINAMRSVYNLGNYVNTGVTHVEDFISGEGSTALNSSVKTDVKFTRNGNTLYGTGSISLYDLKGNLVRTAGNNASEATTMQLQGIRQGVYIAKCQGHTMQIQVK